MAHAHGGLVVLACLVLALSGPVHAQGGGGGGGGSGGGSTGGSGGATGSGTAGTGSQTGSQTDSTMGNATPGITQPGSPLLGSGGTGGGQGSAGGGPQSGNQTGASPGPSGPNRRAQTEGQLRQSGAAPPAHQDEQQLRDLNDLTRRLTPPSTPIPAPEVERR
jgi:hypothetical protein